MYTVCKSGVQKLPFRGWGQGIKNGKLLTSHRSTIYPCYLPVLGEFNRSWPYKTCRGKDKEISVRNCLNYKNVFEKMPDTGYWIYSLFEKPLNYKAPSRIKYPVSVFKN